MNKNDNHYNAYFRLFLDILSIMVLLFSASYSELDRAYYITALVLFFQFIINTLELMEKEVNRTLYGISLFSLLLGSIGVILCIGIFIQNSMKDIHILGIGISNTLYHCLVMVLLLLAYLPGFITWVMFFEKKYKLIGNKTS